MPFLQRKPNLLYDILYFQVVPYMAIILQQRKCACSKVSIKINVLCFIGIDIKNDSYLCVNKVIIAKGTVVPLGMWGPIIINL